VLIFCTSSSGVGGWGSHNLIIGSPGRRRYYCTTVLLAVEYCITGSGVLCYCTTDYWYTVLLYYWYCWYYWYYCTTGTTVLLYYWYYCTTVLLVLLYCWYYCTTGTTGSGVLYYWQWSTVLLAVEYCITGSGILYDWQWSAVEYYCTTVLVLLYCRVVLL
jgi:hypothetical protein